MNQMTPHTHTFSSNLRVTTNQRRLFSIFNTTKYLFSAVSIYLQDKRRPAGCLLLQGVRHFGQILVEA